MIETLNLNSSVELSEKLRKLFFELTFLYDPNSVQKKLNSHVPQITNVDKVIVGPMTSVAIIEEEIKKISNVFYIKIKFDQFYLFFVYSNIIKFSKADYEIYNTISKFLNNSFKLRKYKTLNNEIKNHISTQQKQFKTISLIAETTQFSDTQFLSLLIIKNLNIYLKKQTQLLEKLNIESQYYINLKSVTKLLAIHLNKIKFSLNKFIIFYKKFATYTQG